MIVACSSCGAKYKYDDSRFDGKPSKKIRCTKCQTVFEVKNPGMESAPPEPVSSGPPPVGGELTFTRRGNPAMGQPEEKEKTKEFVVSSTPPRAQRNSANLRLSASKKFSLAAIAGVDSGKTFPVVKPRMVIGRVGADITLSDAEISRNHAAVEFEDDAVTLVDLGSTNGTFVNGQRIETAPLSNYGEFEVGGTTLMLIVTDGP